MLTIDVVKNKFPEARVAWGKNGQEFNVHCPFYHEKGGVYKLYINSKTGTYYCQDCGVSGNSFEDFFDEFFARVRGGLRLIEEATERRKENRISHGGEKPFFAKVGNSVRWGKNNVFAPGETIHLSELDSTHPAYQYMLGRGFDPNEFANDEYPLSVLYCSKGQIELRDGTLKSHARIICPVIQRGEIFGWTARKIERFEGDGDLRRKFVWDGNNWVEVLKESNGNWKDKPIPKWLHLPSMPKSTILYNLDEAENYDSVVLVEGPFDVQRIGLFAVGYFGEFLSGAQIRLIANRWSKVFWIPDKGVDKSSTRFVSNLKDLAEACSVTVLELPDGFDDPGETPRKEILKLIK